MSVKILLTKNPLGNKFPGSFTHDPEWFEPILFDARVRMVYSAALPIHFQFRDARGAVDNYTPLIPIAVL